MEAIVPYLMFNGNAAEALNFYAKAFDGKTLFQQSFGESPMGNETPDEYKSKVMHATFQAGDLTFMVSDNMPGQQVSGGTNLSLSLNFKTVADIDKIFAALSEGAKVTKPLQDTFWEQNLECLPTNLASTGCLIMSMKRKKSKCVSF